MKSIIRHLKRKKPIAQRKLFDEFSDYLFRIAYRYLGDRELAEEVLSTSFLKIFEKIDSTDIEDKAKLMAWMKRITINQSLMELRKSKIETQSLDLLYNVANLESDTQYEGLTENEILHHVQRLPQGYQTVFYLFVVDEYTHEEIAEKLEISIGTSKSQLSRAKQMLRHSMQNKTTKHATING